MTADPSGVFDRRDSRPRESMHESLCGVSEASSSGEWVGNCRPFGCF